MHYVIQENLFKEYGYKLLLEHLQKNDISYETVKYVPFSNEILFKGEKPERKDVFFFGYASAGTAIEKYGWEPGHLINKNFTFEVYRKVYGEHLLNSDMIILPAKDTLIESFGSNFFARPVGDGKEFTGEIFTPESWKDWVRDNGEITDLKVCIASPKTIQQEIRCWIIDGEPVTISQYRIGKRANYLNMDNNEEATLFARQMAKIFSPARAYCLDICLHEDEYKIVEIGCINHCGFYDANMSKLIQGLEKAYSPKIEKDGSKSNS